MSHFTVGVLIPGDTAPTEVENAVGQLLAPFDENIDMEPYPVEIVGEKLAQMQDYYHTTDLGQLAAKMPEWNSCDGKVEGGTLYAMSTYNPQSKWDWWVIGGRWSDTVPGNVCKVRELPEGFDCYALVAPGNPEHPEPFWHEKGQMGWFGMSYNEKGADNWDAERAEVLSAFPGHLLVVVDCHI